MTKSSSIPKFDLNRPKNYLGYVLATDIATSADEIGRILDERDIISNSKLARRGAARLDFVNDSDFLTLTDHGKELIQLANREFGSTDAAINEIGKLYGKGERLVEAQPVWREFLQQSLQRHPGINRLIALMQDIHAETGAEEFQLPEIFFEMYRRSPEFAGELFLREKEVETQLPLSAETLDSDPLSTEFTDPDLYYGPTVQTLKSILYHANILTTAGGDSRSLGPKKDPYIWALEPQFRNETEAKTLQSMSAELTDPEEKAADHEKADRKDVTTSRIIRNNTIVKELKNRYDYTCQVCGDRRQYEPNEGYAEGHHIKPLGSEHEGKDTKANIIVLCPTCHADFDYGMIRINPRDYSIKHAYDDERHEASLTIADGHDLNDDSLRYHNSEIAKFDN